MNWNEVMVIWGPMALVIAVWIYSMSRQGVLFPKGMTYAAYLEELLKETRRQNEALERLLATISERVDRLERK